MIACADGGPEVWTRLTSGAGWMSSSPLAGLPVSYNKNWLAETIGLHPSFFESLRGVCAKIHVPPAKSRMHAISAVTSSRRKTNFIYSLTNIERDIIPHRPAIDLHIVWHPEGGDQDLALYVGQAVDVANRLQDHKKPLYQIKHQNSHYYV